MEKIVVLFIGYILIYLNYINSATTKYLLEEKTLNKIEAAGKWQSEKIDSSCFRDLLVIEVKGYLGLMEFSNITGTEFIPPPSNFSNMTKNYMNYDPRKTKIRECVNYIKNQLKCSASPAFAMANMISDRICIFKNKVKPFILSVQSKNI